MSYNTSPQCRHNIVTSAGASGCLSHSPARPQVGSFATLTVTDRILVYDDDLNVTWLRDAGSRGQSDL